MSILINTINNETIKTRLKSMLFTNIRDIAPYTNKANNKRIVNSTKNAKVESTTEGYIYLLQEREFKNAKQPIYKIGMSCQSDPIQRVKSYPKNSHIYCIVNVDNPRDIETSLCKIFRHNFKHRDDIGREYFEGNVKEMTNIIYKYVLEINDDDTHHGVESISNVDFTVNYIAN